MSENQHTEWKEVWRDDYLRWVCAFANAEGGTLVIGRNDQGEVVGLKNAAKLLEDLPNKVRDVLGVVVDVNLRTEAGRNYLEIVVPAYANPISYKGEYCYRSGSTTQTLKGAALDRFLLRKQGRHWDGLPVPHVAVADLDAKALAQFRKQALKSGRLSGETLQEPDAQLLDKLHLSEGSYLKRAAVLLFHPDAERFVTGAYLKMGYFENNVDLRYQDEVHGDLFTQVSQTMVLLQAKYLKAWISYEGLQRSETFAVPDAALREALLNAVVHKDYAVAAPIQISVYPDKLMIWNPGQLPPDWTLEKLLGKHASLPFNPDLANAFFRAGLIESWGRGMERIQRACHQAGVPTPDLSLDHGGLWVTFRFPPAPAAADEKTPVETPVETPVQTLEETPAAMPLKTPDQILRILRQQPALSLAAVAQAIGKSTSAVERAVAKLGKSGQLRRVGATKTGRWEVLHEAGED